MNSGLWNKFETINDIENREQELYGVKELDNRLWTETPKFEGLSDTEQIEQLSSYMDNLDALKIDNWEGLSFDERLEVLQDIENEAARIEGRAPMIVETVKWPSGMNGCMVWQEGKIQINESLVSSNTLTGLRQCTQTLVHEGRHAYQWHNIYIERTEHSNERFESWKSNIEKVGYLDSRRFGYDMYYIQPVEVDARTYAEDVTSKISYR